MIPTRQELEDGRHRYYRTYGYFWSFCELNSCCENCDKFIRFGCRVKCLIEKMQTRRILKICKEETIEGIQTDDWHEIQQAVMDAPTIIPAGEEGE